MLAGDTSTILGDVTLSGSSILEMELGDDYQPTLGHRRRQHRRHADRCRSLRDYTPQTGDSFEILRSDALAGTFAAVIMTANPGLLWDVTYTTSTASSSPSAASLLPARAPTSTATTSSTAATWRSGSRTSGSARTRRQPATQADGDANGDGVVDGADFMLIQQQFGGPPPAVPAVARRCRNRARCCWRFAAFGLPLAARRRRS